MEKIYAFIDEAKAQRITVAYGGHKDLVADCGPGYFVPPTVRYYCCFHTLYYLTEVYLNVVICMRYMCICWCVYIQVFVDPPLTSRVWCEEIFGPVLCVRVCQKCLHIQYMLVYVCVLSWSTYTYILFSYVFCPICNHTQDFSTEEEAVTVANDSSYGLAAAVLSGTRIIISYLPNPTL